MDTAIPTGRAAGGSGAVTSDRSDLDALWRSVPPGHRPFDIGDFAHLAEPVQRYLAHAIAPGTLLASAVRLRMHGSIKLSRWRPFKAEQVIVQDRGMIWQASVRVHGVEIQGQDSFVDGVGAMRWKLLGLIPVMQASGPDVSRSAAGRVAAESLWLPSALCGAGVSWIADNSATTRVRLSVDGHVADLALALNQGRVQSVALARWGNPEGREFHNADFGAFVEQEATFGGYTIPARLNVGWYFGTDRFDAEGKFFHVTIDDAVYR